jgi:hypothetical protein
MAISFKHPTNEHIKECPEGFSWTTFFFNAWVPLLRKQWGVFAITLFTGGLAGLYFMFTINKIFASHLLELGYSPLSELDQEKLKAIGLHIAKSDTKIIEHGVPEKLSA